jgi:hypothetical protein
MPDAPTLAMPVQTTAGGSGATADVGNQIIDILDNHGPSAADEPPAQEPPAQEPPAQEPPAQEPPAQEPPAQEPPAPDEPMLVPEDVLGGDEPPPAPEPEEEPPEPPNMDEKARKSWEFQKKQRRELKAQVEALEQQLSVAKDTPVPDHEEMQQLRQQVQDYEQRIGQYDLAATTEFKNNFDAPLAAATDKMVQILVRQGRDPEDAKAVVARINRATETGKSDSDIIDEELGSEAYAVQSAALGHIAEYVGLQSRRQEALDHWQETRQAVDVKSKRDEDIALTENVEQDVAVALQQSLKAGNWMYARSNDNQEWNEGVAKREAAVKGILRSAKPEELAMWVMEGVTAKDTRDLFLVAQKQLKEKTAQVQRLTAASPQIQGADGRAPAPTAPTAPRDADAFTRELLADAPRPARFGPA